VWSTLTKKELWTLVECIKDCYPICDVENFSQHHFEASMISTRERFEERQLAMAPECGFRLPACVLRRGPDFDQTVSQKIYNLGIDWR
jgi:hypothetical protein